MKSSHNRMEHQVARTGFVIKAKVSFHYDIQTWFKLLKSIIISVKYRQDIIGWE